MGVCAEPSLILTLPGVCCLSSLRDEVWTLHGRCTQCPVRAHTPWSLGTLPQLMPVVSAPSEMRCGHSLVHAYSPRMGRWLGGEETGAVAAGEFPKVPHEGVFLFGKILLLSPAAPSVQGSTCPLIQPTSPARPGPGQGPTRPNSQLPSQCPQSAQVTTSFLFPSLRLQATRSL